MTELRADYRCSECGELRTRPHAAWCPATAVTGARVSLVLCGIAVAGLLVSTAGMFLWPEPPLAAALALAAAAGLVGGAVGFRLGRGKG